MDILTSTANGVLTIEFNRPGRKNAITAAMYQTMVDVLEQAENDAAVRVIVFVGKPDIFTAGNDLEDFLNHPPRDNDSPVIRFLWCISHAAKPMIAAVAGPAVGVGTTLLLHCDLVYATDQARFSLPFTQLGLCPEAASSLLLPRLAGYQRAAEKLLLGEPFDAQEACSMGLVNQVLPADTLLDTVYKQAARLVALPVSSLRVTKQLMKQGLMADVEQRILDEADQFRLMLNAPEAREAFTAFLARRKPDFRQFD